MQSGTTCQNQELVALQKYLLLLLMLLRRIQQLKADSSFVRMNPRQPQSHRLLAVRIRHFV